MKVPRQSLDNWSKAHLKAREAQNILIRLDLASEDTWEKDGRSGMNVLNERFVREISSGTTFIDINSIVSNVC